MDAAAASRLELQQPLASTNSSPAAEQQQQLAELMVPVHVLLAFQPPLASRTSKAFAAPEYWMVLWGCEGVAAALAADPAGCRPASAAAVAQAAYSAALSASPARVVERYEQQGGHRLVFQDQQLQLQEQGAGQESTEDALLRFLRQPGPSYGNVTAARRDVLSAVPLSTWRGQAEGVPSGGGVAAAGAAGRKALGPAGVRVAMKVPSVAACMEWVALASLRDVPWIQVPAA